MNVKESTDVVYACSDDGGKTFHRVDGSTIAHLPMRVETGPDQASIVDHGNDFGLAANVFFDADGVPAVSYRSPDFVKAIYRYWDSRAGRWSDPVESPAGGQIRVMHHVGPDGILTFVTSSQDAVLIRATDLQLTNTKRYSLLDGGLRYVSSLDQIALRDHGVYRFVAKEHDNSRLSVIRVEFHYTGDQ